MGLIRGILLLVVSIFVCVFLIWLVSPWLTAVGAGQYIPFLWLALVLLVVVELIYTLFR